MTASLLYTRGIVINALSSVFSILAMIALGFVLSIRGWFDGKASALISRLVVGVALPAYMVSNLTGSYDRASLLEMGRWLFIPFGVMILCYLVGFALAVIMRLPKTQRGTFTSMFALSNTIFIGLPVNLVLFGERSVPFVLLYYIANTTMFWTIGVFGIARDGEARETGPNTDARSAYRSPVLLFRTALKRVFSPPLVAFLFATALILLGLSLPKTVLDVCRYLGAMTTPLSMLFIGIVISRVNPKTLRIDRGLVALLLGRFILAPALVFALTRHAEMPELMKKVFFIQAAMPAMTQTSIVAKSYGADEEYAAVATSVTTVLSLAAIPVYIAIIGSPG
jgi:malate permease and related proteins